MNEENPDYKLALLNTRNLYKEFKSADPDPRGYTRLDTPQQGDATIIKQNNTIIFLLVNISEKLDLIRKSLTKQHPDPKVVKDLDDITLKLSGLDLGSGIRKSRKITGQTWNFFRVDPVL